MKSLAILSAAAEKLIAEVHTHLQDGTWSIECGYHYGLEQDLEKDLEELERQLRPLSGRPINLTMVQGYVVQLSDALLEVAHRRADVGARANLDHLQSAVIDQLSGFDGTTSDIDGAIDALDALAFATAWIEVEPPGGTPQAEWDAFSTLASDRPASVAATIVGWVPEGRAEAIGAAMGAMGVSNGIGFFAQSVAAWVGGSGTTVAGAGTVAGLVGAVVGAVLGVLATWYVPREPSDRA